MRSYVNIAGWVLLVLMISSFLLFVGVVSYDHYVIFPRQLQEWKKEFEVNNDKRT